MPPAPAGRSPVQYVTTIASVVVLRDLLESGVLDRDGLLWLRARLARPHEFADCPQLQLLRLDTDVRLSEAYDCLLSDIPDAPGCPDDPRELDLPGVA